MTLIDKTEFWEFALPAASSEFLQELKTILDAAPTVECAACAAHENCSIESEMLYIVKYPERLNGAMCCALFQRRQP